MNFFSNYRFTLDIQKSKSQASLPVHYGDTGNRFYITLTDGGNPYIIPDGCRVDIYINKPAPHNPIVNACVIENNSIVRYEFNKNTASVEGMHKCELRLYSSDGRLITTPSFVMVVDQRVVYDDEIGTEEDFQKLYAMQVIAKEEERIAAEDVRVANENNRIAAEEERDEAERARAEAEEKRENAYAGKFLNGYDLVINTEDEFDKCLYPLYKDEDNLTRDQAVLMVEDDSAFNEPSSDFTARRILVKGVTFKKNRGYDDVRLHIFQPSLEYIKFENCRWETHWKVSGTNPRDSSATNYNLNSTYTPGTDGKPRASSFNRATNALHLAIEGLHVNEDNVADAPVPNGFIGWGIGLRNIKVLTDCHIDYPKTYKIPEIGQNTFEITCQFFDFADTCSVAALWDGMNVSNCTFTKVLKRCYNVSNVQAINLKNSDGSLYVPSIVLCSNIVNARGDFAYDNCSNISATKEFVNTTVSGRVEEAKEYAKEYADTKVPKGAPSSFTDGIMLYGQMPDGRISFKHATTRAGGNEVAIRDANGKLSNSWQDNFEDYGSTYTTKWGKGVCMPRHYIDGKFNICEERVKKIEKYLGGDNFIVDDSTAYQKVVPKNACERARILTIGGMSHKNKNLIQMEYTERHNVLAAGQDRGFYYLSLGDGHIRIDRTVTDGWGVWYGYVQHRTITYLPKGTYTLSLHNVVYSNFIDTGIYFKVGDTNIVAGDKAESGYEFTFTLDNTTPVSCGFQVEDNYDVTYIGEGSFECDIMLNEGSTAEPFESTDLGLKDARVNSIKICGANLAEMKNGTYNLLNEGVATPYNATLNDGHIRINKTVSDSPREVSSRELMQYTAVKLPEGDYTLSFKNVKMSAIGFVGLYVTYDETEYVSGVSIANGYTLRISIGKPMTIKYGFYMVDMETYMYDGYLECDVMLNNGNSELPFKPVVVKSISVPTVVQNQAFYGVGTDKDIYNYYDVKNKKVYTKCKKVVLDGSADEEWTIDSGYFKTVIPGISTVLGGTGIAHLVCDKYQQDFGDNLQDAIPSIKDLHFYGRSSWFGYGAVVFRDTSVGLDVNEWRTRLNKKPITLVYSLAVPSVMDVSSMVTDDGIIDVEGCGTITAVNDYNLPSPSSIKYLVTYPKEV